MKVSETLLKAWQQKRTRGDVRRLVEYTNTSKPTIINAITHGRASEEIILKISLYYSEKATAQEINSKALNLIYDAETTANN